ncbi:hypothetical protein AMJ57_00740 [Parcubacteria bacterium SG8_24]|nr:MAG: hypothetical protein AMJ57_00740 [Parcubacteria bacterium SG8_24]
MTPYRPVSTVYLGLDPGFADLGYGVIEIKDSRERCLTYGSIQTSPALPAAARLQELYARLEEVVERFRPSHVALERIFFSKNVKTAMSVAEARGVIRLCLENNRIPYREFGPSEVKVAVCGHGRAGKKEMQKMVQMLLNLRETPRPDDAADALALAITLAHTRTFYRQQV